MFTACHHDYALVFERFELAGHRYVVFVTETKLAVVVQSPTEDLPFLVQVEGVVVTSKDIDGITRAYFFN
jgi:hypothetical protein